MSQSSRVLVLCNGAHGTKKQTRDSKVLKLACKPKGEKCLVRLELPRFIDAVYHLPDRVLDLLELAAYVFAADRHAFRGPKDAVEYNAWARDFHFIVRVRDFSFWNRKSIKEKLAAALAFMTGDQQYTFDFKPGHRTPTNSLFDREEFHIDKRSSDCAVALFSGGLDSLAGVLDRLKTTQNDIYLISHRSGQPSTKKTQEQLVAALERRHPRRLRHFSFDCGSGGIRAPEETQRTRAFVFNSIAYALAHCLSLDRCFAYENGVTSLNFSRRQDQLAARASRTTHPMTHRRMSEFLTEVHGGEFSIRNPFWDKTKTDVFKLIEQHGGADLINSTVSCSKTFRTQNTASHCGCCFQCVDRRIAAYASGLSQYDKGIYASDIITNPIELGETKTTAVDYVRQSVAFAKSTPESFYADRAAELDDVIDCIPARNQTEAISLIWQLCHRQGEQVLDGLKQMQQVHEDLRLPFEKGSLLQIVSVREYLKSNSRRLAEKIASKLKCAIPVAFQSQQPNGEKGVNDQIQAILAAEAEGYKREFTDTTFALAKCVPDHSQDDVLIEAKFIRNNTTPSKASEDIAADIAKYSSAKFILFVVYDPFRSIKDDSTFVRDIESKRDCLVSIIR